MTIKSRTLRLPSDPAEALEAIAGVDEVSVNEEIQRAIATHIEARRSDPDFRRRLKASIERNREILERLAPTSSWRTTCSSRRRSSPRGMTLPSKRRAGHGWP